MPKARARSAHNPRWAYEPQGEKAIRACEFGGCAAAGDYRAPKSREPKNGHYWFCLEHVRQYNAAWDFFAGMSQAEIEDYQRENSTWQRPTWSIGARPADGGFGGWVQDDFGILAELGWQFARSAQRKPARPVDIEERRALNTLGLEPEVSLNQIKSRYKELAKRYHPDANGGDKAAEERLKGINQAYTYLLGCGYA